MQVLFFMIALSGGAWLCFSRRTFDWLTVAYFSACIYFMSGFFGYVLFFESRYELSNGSYLIMCLVLLVLFLTTIVYDLTPVPEREEEQPHDRGASHHLGLYLFLFSLVGFFMSYRYSGEAFFYPRKAEMMETFNRWHVLWMSSVIMSTILSYNARRHLLLAGLALQQLFLVYVGFRMPLVLSVIGIFTLHIYRKGPRRFLLSNTRVILLGLAFVFLVFAYKRIYIYVKLGEIKQGYYERLATPHFFTDTFLKSEATVQALIINEVLQERFRVGPEHVKENLVQAFINPFRSLSDRREVSFNSKFQPTLFSEIRGGMASSIWAEMWSSGGWGLLAAWIFFYTAVLYLGCWFMARISHAAQGVLACWLPFWSFFVHRNDLNALLSFFFKQLLVLWVAALFCALLHER
ncbi:MAG: hypothetical protein AAF492_15745, partial [Verrucomicrobiota bacterium]